eukprot:CAMPEP_0117590162 /NCGR_PEP_ID=MMETSP0784-20121206/70820_1 /TAXON_ID=39447 /ORGANISM="" /LENGTH=87 /DNA_ID=CAMNT_0005391735 /DNA_START=267 /DNA_END=527 /DNA_ORIENTATION=+
MAIGAWPESTKTAKPNATPKAKRPRGDASLSPSMPPKDGGLQGNAFLVVAATAVVVEACKGHMVDEGVTKAAMTCKDETQATNAVAR